MFGLLLPFKKSNLYQWTVENIDEVEPHVKLRDIFTLQPSLAEKIHTSRNPYVRGYFIIKFFYCAMNKHGQIALG